MRVFLDCKQYKISPFQPKLYSQVLYIVAKADSTRNKPYNQSFITAVLMDYAPGVIALGSLRWLICVILFPEYKYSYRNE